MKAKSQRKKAVGVWARGGTHNWIAGLCWTLLVCMPKLAAASWLSDITGINIDIPAQKFEIGTPNLAAISDMIQHLPQDAANFFLNPAGPPLAFLIREAEGNASRSARPIPYQIRQALVPFFPPVILDGARWTTAAESGVNLAAQLERANGDIGAMTANDIIIFRGPSEAQSIRLWAHELVHVSQYRNMGVEGFAAMYAGWGAKRIEDDAYAWEDHVTQLLQQPPVSPQDMQPGPAPSPFPPQWAVRGSPNPLTWQEFHQAALQTIPANRCVEHQTPNPMTLSIRNICTIGVQVVAVHLGNNVFPCESDDCFFPAGNEHSLSASWPLPQPVDSVDFRFVENANDDEEDPGDPES